MELNINGESQEAILAVDNKQVRLLTKSVNVPVDNFISVANFFCTFYTWSSTIGAFPYLLFQHSSDVAVILLVVTGCSIVLTVCVIIYLGYKSTAAGPNHKKVDDFARLSGLSESNAWWIVSNPYTRARYVFMGLLVLFVSTFIGAAATLSNRISVVYVMVCGLYVWITGLMVCLSYYDKGVEVARLCVTSFFVPPLLLCIIPLVLRFAPVSDIFKWNDVDLIIVGCAHIFHCFLIYLFARLHLAGSVAQKIK